MPFQELIEEAGCRLDSDTVVFGKRFLKMSSFRLVLNSVP